MMPNRRPLETPPFHVAPVSYVAPGIWDCAAARAGNGSGRIATGGIHQ